MEVSRTESERTSWWQAGRAPRQGCRSPAECPASSGLNSAVWAADGPALPAPVRAQPGSRTGRTRQEEAGGEATGGHRLPAEAPWGPSSGSQLHLVLRTVGSLLSVSKDRGTHHHLDPIMVQKERVTP